jgi:hypothetical protein
MFPDVSGTVASVYSSWRYRWHYLRKKTSISRAVRVLHRPLPALCPCVLGSTMRVRRDAQAGVYRRCGPRAVPPGARRAERRLAVDIFAAAWRHPGPPCPASRAGHTGALVARGVHTRRIGGHATPRPLLVHLLQWGPVLPRPGSSGWGRVSPTRRFARSPTPIRGPEPASARRRAARPASTVRTRRAQG